MNFTSRRAFARMLIALLLLAVNLRLAVTSAAALLALLIDDGALTPQAAVLVPALPTAMFAIAGVLTPRLSRRLGAGSAVTWAMVALIAGLLVRSIPNPIAVVLGTVLATAGIAVINVLMPALVRAAAGARIRAVTTAYTTLMSLAAALGAAAAVPIALALGSSSLGLGMWVLPAVLALVVWMLVARSADVNGAMSTRASDVRRSLPAGTWALTGFFALQALSSFVLMGWLPTIAIDAGIDAARAGMLLGIVMVVSIPSAIAAVSVSHRTIGVRIGVLVVGVTSIGGMLGFWLMPTLAPEVWAALLGIGSAAFPLALALMARAGRDAADTARVSGVAQGVGYTIATLGPLGAGAWYSLGGDWGAVLAALVVGAFAQAVIGLALASRRGAASRCADTPGTRRYPQVRTSTAGGVGDT